MNQRFLRIHGDNILECERTLTCIEGALHAKAIVNHESPTFKPCYNIEAEGCLFLLELLPGLGRWGFDLAKMLLTKGGVLDETPDAYLTEVIEGKEKVLLALEYSSALPAGNNAWQRNGRAYSCAKAGIPYLYITELGGLELDESRNVKATRLPNPLVPFSYISMTRRSGMLCMPVYQRHPSIREDVAKKFRDVFDRGECLSIMRGILLGEDLQRAIDSLTQKTLNLISLRESKNSFSGNDWNRLLEAENPAEWIYRKKHQLLWKKSEPGKVETTNDYAHFFNEVLSLGCLTIGYTPFPISLVQPSKVAAFKGLLKKYFPRISISLHKEPLVVIWMTGFKPRGDDSRPDRGLNPLARMLFGENTKILSIISGPSRYTIKDAAHIDNGLWLSAFKCSDYILQDSIHIKKPVLYKVIRSVEQPHEAPTFAYTKAVIQNVGEHDIDTAIHQLFARRESYGIFEGMCNPPGGDWSGISYFGDHLTEYRWTSLPRVSAKQHKRPDHFIQFRGPQTDLFLTVESKGTASSLEGNIGTRLKGFMEDLFATSVTAERDKDGDWKTGVDRTLSMRPYVNLSVGAFLYNPKNNLRKICLSKELDMVMALEFSGAVTVLHLCIPNDAWGIEATLKELCLGIGNMIVQID